MTRYVCPKCGSYEVDRVIRIDLNSTHSHRDAYLASARCLASHERDPDEFVAQDAGCGDCGHESSVDAFDTNTKESKT